MNERGFMLPVMGWAAIAAGAVILGLGVAVKVQTSRLATSKAETVAVQGRFDAFVSQAKALGDAQNAKAKETDAANKQLKEKSDAQSAKSKADLAAVYAKYRGLLNAKPNSGGGQLPPAAAVTSGTDRTCFATDQFARAMGVLEAGVPNITEQGDAAKSRLTGAMKWAESLARP